MLDLSKKIIALILVFLYFETLANSGTLRKCEPISTSAGFKYVGTYCIDYECKFVVRKIFDVYCPYLLLDK